MFCVDETKLPEDSYLNQRLQCVCVCVSLESLELTE